MKSKALPNTNHWRSDPLASLVLLLMLLLGLGVPVCGTSWDLKLNADATIEFFPDRCFGWDRAVRESLVLWVAGELPWEMEATEIWEHGGAVVPLPTTDDLRRLARALSDESLVAQVRSTAETVDGCASRLALLGPSIAIDDVEDALEDMEAALDDLLDGIEDLPVGGDREPVAALYECAGQMEDVVDGLEYIASRIRLYAHDSVRAELAEWVREIALEAVNGEGSRYIRSIQALLQHILALHGRQIHADAAGAIRSRGDRLLRLCTERTTGRSLDVDLSTTLFEVEVEASSGITETDSAAPSRRKIASTGGVAIEAELEGMAIDLGVQRSETDYLDSIKDASDAQVRRAELQVESEVEGHQLRIGLEGSRKRCPGDIDGQFAAGSAVVIRSNIVRLQTQIENAGLPNEITAELVGHVASALQALDIGDLESAVDPMADFIDEVNDLVWEGSLAPAVGDGLVAAAWEILPKRVEREWTAPASIALDMGSDGSLDVDVSIGQRRVPTNPRLDWLRREGSVDWQREARWAAVEIGMEGGRVEYPNDPGRTNHTSQTSYAVGWVHEEWTVDFESSSSSTTYPHATKKDKLESDDALCLGCDVDSITASLELEQSVVWYPNDPGRPITHRRDREFEVACRLGVLDFDLSSSCTRYLDEVGLELRVQRGMQLAAEWAPSDSLQLEAEWTWHEVIDWESPEKDTSSRRLAVSFEWKL